MPSLAPLAATMRSQASATSSPPATAKPSMAAISGLREARWTMPAKPRSPTHALSPATNALRSMPALKPLPEPVSTPTCSSAVSSSSSSAAATPSACALLNALRWSGRLSVMSRIPSRRSVRTASLAVAVSDMAGTLGEQDEIRLALAAQHREVDLDPADPARLGQHARLGLDDLRGEHAAARGHRGVAADALEVARELLDGVDVADPLDLDGDPLVLVVAAHEVHRADVGRPLAAHEPQPLAAPLGRVGQLDLEVGLDAVLRERGRLAPVMGDVGEDLDDADVEPVLAHDLAHDDGARLLLDDARRGHPVLRLVAPGVGVDHDRAVALDHDQPQRLGQERLDQAAGVDDLAAGDDEPHEAAESTAGPRRTPRPPLPQPPRGGAIPGARPP